MKNKILNQLEAINRRTTCFPTQPLPDDLRTTAMDLTLPDVKPGILSVELMLSELVQVFA